MAKSDKKPSDPAKPTDEPPVTDPVAPAVTLHENADVSALQAELEKSRAESESLRGQLSRADEGHLQLQAEVKRLQADATQHIARQEAEIERLRQLLATPVRVALPAVVALPPVSVATRRARVTIPDTHVGTIDVTIPADLTGLAAEHAAKEAAKAARGIINFGGGTPSVEFLD